MGRLIRKDICPSCKKQLQCLYDDGYTRWYCPRCKYKRIDGAQENPWKVFYGKKGGEVGMSIQVNDFQWEPGKNDVEYMKLLESSRDGWQKIAQIAIAKLKALSKAQETVVMVGAELTDAELIEKIREAPIVMKPNVDAVPVVHARWKNNGNETVSCSRCATWFPKEREPYMLYCGCCGARMDGERRDENETGRP